MLNRTLAASVALLAFLPGAAAAGPAGSAVLEQAYGRNEALAAYTFDVDVAMAMHHFPWLHFRMQGTGTYERGTRYNVHFTKMPWFARAHPDIDLSVLDPQMWPQRYTADVSGSRGDDTLFALHQVGGDDLKEADVAINPTLGTQWVSLEYSDGTRIEMNVTSKAAAGYLVPASIAAEIDYPGMPLSADAAFSDYAFGGQGALQPIQR
jgi:hypothetical protein